MNEYDNNTPNDFVNNATLWLHLIASEANAASQCLGALHPDMHVLLQEIYTAVLIFHHAKEHLPINVPTFLAPPSLESTVLNGDGCLFIPPLYEPQETLSFFHLKGISIISTTDFEMPWTLQNWCPEETPFPVGIP